MKTYEILRAKGSNVRCIRPTATLEDVVGELVEHNIGALLVMDNDEMHGIITERDILRTCAEDVRPLAQISVSERMTRNLVTGSPDDEVTHVMGLLTNRRIRHLPVVEDNRVIGIISIGDIVKAQHATLSLENEYLKTYIQS